MILSASINLFDGEELLPALLRNWRPRVEHLTVVYQDVSNRGTPAHVDFRAWMAGLLKLGWIDAAVSYDPLARPDFSPREHERAKRHIGLELARLCGATHFLSVDVDEFYEATQFDAGREFVETGGFDGSACRLLEYHRFPTYQRYELATFDGEALFVPFIFSVEAGLKSQEPNFFELFDPTRALPCERPHTFSPDQLVMHHMTSVRRDRQSLLRKFSNTSAEWPLETPERLADLVLGFDPKIHAAPCVKETDNLFNIHFDSDDALSAERCNYQQRRQA